MKLLAFIAVLFMVTMSQASASLRHKGEVESRNAAEPGPKSIPKYGYPGNKEKGYEKEKGPGKEKGPEKEKGPGKEKGPEKGPGKRH
jgi:hypothetical protein